jgi:hypothetical protein
MGAGASCEDQQRRQWVSKLEKGNLRTVLQKIEKGKEQVTDISIPDESLSLEKQQRSLPLLALYLQRIDTVVTLNIPRCEITPDELSVLCPILSRSAHLSSLDLSHNDITKDGSLLGMHSLSALIKESRTLVTLKLVGTKFDFPLPKKKVRTKKQKALMVMPKSKHKMKFSESSHSKVGKIRSGGGQDIDAVLRDASRVNRKIGGKEKNLGTGSKNKHGRKAEEAMEAARQEQLKRLAKSQHDKAAKAFSMVVDKRQIKREGLKWEDCEPAFQYFSTADIMGGVADPAGFVPKLVAAAYAVQTKREGQKHAMELTGEVAEETRDERIDRLQAEDDAKRKAQAEAEQAEKDEVLRKREEEAREKTAAEAKIERELDELMNAVHTFSVLDEYESLFILADALLDNEQVQTLLLRDVELPVQQFKTTKDLDLEHKGLSVEDAVVIGRLLSVNRKLRFFDVSDNRITGPQDEVTCCGTILNGVKALAWGISRGPARTLNSVSFEDTELGPKGMEEVAKIIPGLVSLRTLDVRFNRIGLDGAAHLLEAVKKQRVAATGKEDVLGLSKKQKKELARKAMEELAAEEARQEEEKKARIVAEEEAKKKAEEPEDAEEEEYSDKEEEEEEEGGEGEKGNEAKAEGKADDAGEDSDIRCSNILE